MAQKVRPWDGAIVGKHLTWNKLSHPSLQRMLRSPDQGHYESTQVSRKSAVRKSSTTKLPLLQGGEEGGVVHGPKRANRFAHEPSLNSESQRRVSFPQ